ncbi:hypothetical protein PLESTB_000754100 [Pleodorina starrii]|uniref:Uncharacterized protein n=1 Tax=Pleodorina starrii TaxID=330485 RepID=A0A9W6F2Q7_9CHLO|nr:hypothetical protein PLESTM_001569300 [Pleodorina starrii]GLC53474.1 hypothetical protein PLESTB_000753700 [Pleodorina starrii]GLC53476.1 hypothetical protein PLESTB_000753900 [Pleodorina starrii]GLC53478.1 hypothetical protein PLESTB_000754100 [Pleodorina starrii]
MTSSPPLPQRQASTPSTAAADSATSSGVSRQRACASPAVAITDAVIPSPLILHAPAGGGGERRKGAAGGPLQYCGLVLHTQLLQHMAAPLALKAIAAPVGPTHGSVLSRLRVLVTAGGTGSLALLLARCWLVG